MHSISPHASNAIGLSNAVIVMRAPIIATITVIVQIINHSAIHCVKIVGSLPFHGTLGTRGFPWGFQWAVDAKRVI